MNRMFLLRVFLAIVVVLDVTSYSYAGSDRWIMAMTAKRMDKANLVFVRFFGPDGVALESDALEKMVVREQDCSSGHVYALSKDYKMGYAPKNMLLGIYLSPNVWSNKTLCFSVQDLGRVVQSLDPAVNNSRNFQFNLVP